MLSGRALTIDRGKLASFAIGGMLVVLSLALRGAMPVQAEGGAIHDDALFIRLAGNVAAGRWLGAYDQLTLAKGSAYPIFIALASLVGVPLKIAEHLVYLSGCVVLATAVQALFRVRASGLVLLALLALNPVFWSEESLGRVVREGLYIGLVAWIFGLSVFCFVLGREGPIAAEARRKAGLLVALGACGGLFWLTREEGIWLAPSMLVFIASWAWRARREAATGSMARTAVQAAGFLAIPLAAFAVVVGAMDTANLRAYGAFVNSELRSGEFRAAYGALARIEHAHWRRFVPFPVEARRAAYAASPAARELAPSLDGPAGKAWRDLGCADAGIASDACSEILSGWLVWALRDAAAAAGHFRSAATAAAYFDRLAREVNEACDRGSLACGPRRDTLAPAWRAEYLDPAAAAARSVGRRLVTLGDMHVRPKASSGSPEQLAPFQRMAGGRLSGAQPSAPAAALLGLAEPIARVQVALTSWAVPVAAIAWALLLGHAVMRRRVHPGHVVVAALALAAVVRVVLLAVVDATSFPADNLLYLTPATPLTIAFAPCVAFLLLARLRSGDR